jgi:colanic acid biosynthesis glycosyl transferase WcaI
MSTELSGTSRLRDPVGKPLAARPSTFWVVSELYYPQETATGCLLTQLAEGLAHASDSRQRVGVLCAMPPRLPHGSEPPAREERAGVHIHRCRATTLNKDNLLLRLANAATQTLALAWAVLRRVERGDAVLVVTNPPTLPFLVALICTLKRTPCILLIHDLYPDAAVAAGMLKEGCLVVQAIRLCNHALYRHVARIVVLGRDMQERVRCLLPGEPQRVVVIPNWAEPDAIHPCDRDATQLVQELNLGGKFIVEYAGNMARVNDVETLLCCAEQLRERSDIHFLFLGAGARRRWLEEQVTQRALTNVSLVANRPRRNQADFLNACDVGVVALCRGMYGVSVPSRTYNIMAAGRPVLAIVEPGSEIARMVEEEGAGWVVPPGDAEQLAQKIESLAGDRRALLAAGQRARCAAETTYSLPSVLHAYQELLHSLHLPSL